MSPQPARRDDDVESLVGDYLRQEARAVDAGRILAGVRWRQSAAAARARRDSGVISHVARAAGRWGTGIAAALIVVAVVWSSRQNSVRADAVKLVREARTALDQSPADRAYRVEIVLAPGMAERSPFLAALATFDCRLWTRTDRFWIEGTRSNVAWDFGRDANRHVWIHPSRSVGLDFAPEDVPAPMDEALDLFSFDLDTVLRLLSDELDVTTIRPGTDSQPGVMRIRGTPRDKRRRTRVRTVTVEIEEKTKVVRRVVVERVRDGQPLADVSFTLERAGQQPDTVYQVMGHLEPDAEVLGPDRRLRRRRELLRFFGSLLLEGN